MTFVEFEALIAEKQGVLEELTGETDVQTMCSQTYEAADPNGYSDADAFKTKIYRNLDFD